MEGQAAKEDLRKKQWTWDELADLADKSIKAAARLEESIRSTIRKKNSRNRRRKVIWLPPPTKERKG